MILDSRALSKSRRLGTRWVSTMLSLCLTTSVNAFVAAQPLDVTTRTTARELATQGAEAFERGDYVAALDCLSRANTLHPAPSISVLQARTLQHLGRYLEALDRYEETQRMSLPEDAPEAYRVAVRDATIEGDQLRQRIPHLSVQVRQGGVTPKGISVVIDGKALPAVLLDVDFPADPGDHNVVVKAPKHEAVTRRVYLAEKERVVLEIALDDFVEPAPAVLAAPLPAASAVPGPRPVWGWSAVGGGAAALVVSAMTGKAALDKKSRLDAICDPGCPADSARDIDSFRSYRTVSYVAGGVAVALIGVGGYLLLSGSRSEPTVAVGVVGTQAGVWGAF